MSGKTTGKVWDVKLPLPKKFVLLALADKADHNDENIHPGVPLVARMTGYSERQVRRIIKQLVEDGILVLMDAPLGKPSNYKINFSRTVQVGDDTPLTPDIAMTTDITVSGVENVQTHGKKMDIAMTPDIAMSPLTSHGKNKTQTPDIASLKVTDERIKENGKKRESRAPIDFPQTPANDINGGMYKNDTAAYIQAEVFLRTYEQVCKEKGAPQTLARTVRNKDFGVRYYRDGYTADEIRSVVENSIADGKLIPFAFLGEALAQHRVAKKPVPVEIKTNTPRIPLEQDVDTWVRKS